MSDGQPQGPSNDGVDWTAPVDPLFATAWNDVYAEEGDTAAGEGAETTGPGEGGGATPPAPVEGDGSTGAGTAQPSEPAQPTPSDAPGGASVAGEPAAPRPGEQSGIPADGQPGAQPVPTGADYATVAPLFATASEKITERFENAFRAEAIEDVRTQVDPKFIEAMNKDPYWLVGSEVPSMRENGKTITLRDVTEAKDWQGAVERTLASQVEANAAARMANVKDMTSVLQDTVLLFQNNKDLVPYTKQYDAELAKEFTEAAKGFELRVDGKMYGYRVPVQDLINHVRSQIVARRASAPAQPATPPAQQQLNPRDAPTGQFRSPQGGVLSRTAGTGTEDTDDYGAFWGATPFKGMPGIGI